MPDVIGMAMRGLTPQQPCLRAYRVVGDVSVGQGYPAGVSAASPAMPGYWQRKTGTQTPGVRVAQMIQAAVRP